MYGIFLDISGKELMKLTHLHRCAGSAHRMSPHAVALAGAGVRAQGDPLMPSFFAPAAVITTGRTKCPLHSQARRLSASFEVLFLPITCGSGVANLSPGNHQLRLRAEMQLIRATKPADALVRPSQTAQPNGRQEGQWPMLQGLA